MRQLLRNGTATTILNPMNIPQFFTFGQVEKQFQIAKATLSRDRKGGKLSAEKQPDGSYRVALSELIRTYGDRLKPRVVATGHDNSHLERSSTPATTPETAAFTAQLEGLRNELEQVKDERDHLRRVLADEMEERRKLTALLTDRRQPEPVPISPQKPVEGRWARAWSILRGRA